MAGRGIGVLTGADGIGGAQLYETGHRSAGPGEKVAPVSDRLSLRQHLRVLA